MAEDFGLRLPYLMRRLSDALTQQLDRTLRNYALTHAQLSALAQLSLSNREGMSAADLSYRSGVTAQSMSAAITSLEARDLVVRTAHPHHGRILEIRITAPGRELLKDAQAATKLIHDQTLSYLSPDEQELLRNLLRTLMTAMNLYLPPTMAVR